MSRWLIVLLAAFLIAAAPPAPTGVQVMPWSGILHPTRAANWTAPGVVDGIPSGTWVSCVTTACNTLWNNGTDGTQVTAGNINAAITSATANTVVRIPGAGTSRTMSTGLVMKSNIVLRGQGANQTILNFTGNNGCVGDYGAMICMMTVKEYYAEAPMQPGGAQAATWSGGYTQGTTAITLTGIGSNGISVGKYIYLDQAEDTATNSGFFVCENTSASPMCTWEGGAGDPGRVVSGIARQQIQIVKVTGCSPTCTNGSTFFITPGLYAPNWSAGKSPGAWWPTTQLTNAGVENLSISSTQTDVNGIDIMNANNVWVSGVRIVKNCNCSRSLIRMWQVARATIQNNYLYGQQGQSVSYGIESYIGSDLLVQNNIVQHTPAPMMFHANTGSVYAYNFTINNTYDDGTNTWQIQSFIGHSAGVMHNLIEGNIGSGAGGDCIHGNPVMNTVFRNFFTGRDVGRTGNTYPIMFEAWARYWNIVGNVLGTSGYHTTYSTLTGSPDSSIYNVGMGRGTIPNDSVLASTFLRWGNWDVVTSTNDNGTNDQTGTKWVNGEVPTTAPTYPNPVPTYRPAQTLPPSFYLSAKPSWWPAAKVWPPIGPEVTGGNIANTGGHANTIPAQDCYLNVMGGPADGTGSVLAFNAATCYP